MEFTGGHPQLQTTLPDVVRAFQKKTANRLEVWRGEFDTPDPPISMWCDRSAWSGASGGW